MQYDKIKTLQCTIEFVIRLIICASIGLFIIKLYSESCSSMHIKVY